MINTSFLTLPDPRIKPAGSRDPLGFQSIWVKIGRELVGDNLTTITSSIDNFIITLLACHYSFKEQDEEKKMEVFFKVEQLCAYLRIADDGITTKSHTNNIMGITRAAKNYKDNTMFLGKGSRAEIFGYQKSSGLWGYYSSALAMSDLINKEKTKIEGKGKTIIEKFITQFSFDNLIELNEISVSKINDKKRRFIQALEDVSDDMESIVLSKTKYDIYPKVRLFFQTDSENKGYKQFYLWLKEKYPQDQLTLAVKEAKKTDIALYVASKVFNFCRSNRGESIDSVAEVISKSKLSEVQLEKTVLEMNLFIEYWNKKDFTKVIEEVLRLHGIAMENRTSSEWILLKDDKLKVVVAAKTQLPKTLDDDVWQYNYFLYSYINIAYEVYNESNHNG